MVEEQLVRRDSAFEEESSDEWKDETLSVKTEASGDCGDGGGLEENNKDGIILELPPPPDGSWGWVIVAASFLCNLILDGISYTFGVFLDDFVTYFNEPKAKIAWAGSLLTGVYLTIGPVVSGLTNKFGCRPVMMCGSVTAFIAFAVSVLSPSADILILTYGVMGGIGFGMIYLPAIVSVGYYFEKKRALATGISVCGSGMGTFVFAPLAQFLLEKYGWQGANLILAGIILNCFIFGALVRPLQATQVANPNLLETMEDEKYRYMYGSHDSAYFTVQKPDGSYERSALKIPVNTEPGVHSTLNLNEESPVTPLSHTLPTIKEAKPLTNNDLSNSKTDEVKVEEQKVKVNLDNVDIDNRASYLEHKRASVDSTTFRDSQSSNYLMNLPPNVRHSIVSAEFPNSAMLRYLSPSPSIKSYLRSESIPRNGSHPVLEEIKASIPKNDSAPQFESVKQKHKIPQEINLGSNGSITNKRGSLLKSNISIYSARKRQSSVCSNVSRDSVFIHLPGNSRRTSVSNHSINPLHRKDIFYMGSVQSLKMSQQSLTSYRQSVINLNPLEVTEEVSPRDYSTPHKHRRFQCDSCTDIMNTMLDWSLLKDPVFLIVGISNIFGMLGFYIPFVFLIDAAVTKGIEANKAAFLISIVGITNTIGRVISGIIADVPRFNAFLINNLSILLTGVVVFCTAFADDYPSLVCVAVGFGLFSSPYIALTSIVLVELLGLEKLTNSFGLLILFRGGACMLGPPIAGAVYDSSGSYDYSFFFGGSMLIISSLVSFLAPVARRCKRDDSEEEFDGGITMDFPAAEAAV